MKMVGSWDRFLGIDIPSVPAATAVDVRSLGLSASLFGNASQIWAMRPFPIMFHIFELNTQKQVSAHYLG